MSRKERPPAPHRTFSARTHKTNPVTRMTEALFLKHQDLNGLTHQTAIFVTKKPARSPVNQSDITSLVNHDRGGRKGVGYGGNSIRHFPRVHCTKARSAPIRQPSTIFDSWKSGKDVRPLPAMNLRKTLLPIVEFFRSQFRNARKTTQTQILQNETFPLLSNSHSFPRPIFNLVNSRPVNSTTLDRNPAFSDETPE